MRKVILGDNKRVGPWIEKHGGGQYREGTQTIGLEKDGELIAGVMYDYFNGSSIYMHVAAKGAHWLDRNYLWSCFAYPFNQLKAKVIIGLVGEKDTKARRFDEHLGFKLQAEIPDGHPDGKLLIYVLKAENCRWIKEEHGQAVGSLIA